MGKIYSQINIGDTASFQKTISEADVYMFAGVTGDMNPAHINHEAMKDSKFGGRIVHGMLPAGLVSAVLGMQLPGPGTIYLSQQLNFKAPVKMGETVKAVVEVLEKLEKGRVRLKTNCYNQDGVEVLDGEALVIAPRE